MSLSKVPNMFCSWFFIFLFRVFLLIQLVSIVSFITWLNDCVHSNQNEDRWWDFHCKIKVLCVYYLIGQHCSSPNYWKFRYAATFMGCFLLPVLMLFAYLGSSYYTYGMHHNRLVSLTFSSSPGHWYSSNSWQVYLSTQKYATIILSCILLDCFLWNDHALALMFFSSYSLWFYWRQQVNAGFLTPGFMGLYLVFLCWSAVRRHIFCFLSWQALLLKTVLFEICLRNGKIISLWSVFSFNKIVLFFIISSEPPETKCIKKSEAATKGDWLSIIVSTVTLNNIILFRNTVHTPSWNWTFLLPSMLAKYELSYTRTEVLTDYSWTVSYIN